jgi:hypothetical protein
MRRAIGCCKRACAVDLPRSAAPGDAPRRGKRPAPGLATWSESSGIWMGKTPGGHIQPPPPLTLRAFYFVAAERRPGIRQTHVPLRRETRPRRFHSERASGVGKLDSKLSTRRMRVRKRGETGVRPCTNASAEVMVRMPPGLAISLQRRHHVSCSHAAAAGHPRQIPVP